MKLRLAHLSRLPEVRYYDFQYCCFKGLWYNKADGLSVCDLGGDVNQDGIVDSGDMNPIENASVALTMGYIAEDVNGDGLIDW